jgi:hypothetical protein
MDRRCLRSADDVERDGLMRVAAEAADLKISAPGIQGIADGGGRLRRTLVAEHAVIPSLASRSATLRASLARSADA